MFHRRARLRISTSGIGGKLASEDAEDAEGDQTSRLCLNKTTRTTVFFRGSSQRPPRPPREKTFFVGVKMDDFGTQDWSSP